MDWNFTRKGLLGIIRRIVNPAIQFASRNAKSLAVMAAVLAMLSWITSSTVSDWARGCRDEASSWKDRIDSTREGYRTRRWQSDLDRRLMLAGVSNRHKDEHLTASQRALQSYHFFMDECSVFLSEVRDLSDVIESLACACGSANSPRKVAADRLLSQARELYDIVRVHENAMLQEVVGKGLVIGELSDTECQEKIRSIMRHGMAIRDAVRTSANDIHNEYVRLHNAFHNELLEKAKQFSLAARVIGWLTIALAGLATCLEIYGLAAEALSKKDPSIREIIRDELDRHSSRLPRRGESLGNATSEAVSGDRV